MIWTVTGNFDPVDQEQILDSSLPIREITYSTVHPDSQIRHITLNDYSNASPELIIIATSSDIACQMKWFAVSNCPSNLDFNYENNTFTISEIQSTEQIESILELVEKYSNDISTPLFESNIHIALGSQMREAISQSQLGSFVDDPQQAELLFPDVPTHDPEYPSEASNPRFGG